MYTYGLTISTCIRMDSLFTKITSAKTANIITIFRLF